MKDKVLGFDIGTQSLKVAIIDRLGKIENIVQKKYDPPFFIKEDGYAEQSPNFYYDLMCKASRELKEIRGDFNDVECFFISTIRDTVICLDENKDPLRDIILWCDARRANFFKGCVKKKTRAVFKLLGKSEVLEKQYTDCHGNWLKQNEPEIWDKTKHFVFISTYLNYLATGKLIDATSSLIAHIPLNYKTMEYYKPSSIMNSIFDIPSEKLPDHIPSEKMIGTINKSFSKDTGLPEGLPLISTGSDKALETLALGVISEKDGAAISFGTTATIQLHSKKYVEPQKYMPAYPSVINGAFDLEIQIQRGFWLVSWFKKEFGKHDELIAKTKHLYTEDILNESLDHTPPGNDGLILQPFWAPSVLTPEAKGCIVGFNEKHTKYSLYRAIIEGLGYALYDGLLMMERQSKRKIDHLYVSGGGSKSDRICQITSDIFNLPLSRIQTHEATLLGGAMVCYKYLKVYEDYHQAKEKMVHYKKTFLPNQENHKIYEKYFQEGYLSLYKSLEPIYRRIKK